jgi:hypothetical protein
MPGVPEQIQMFSIQIERKEFRRPSSPVKGKKRKGTKERERNGRNQCF